MPPPLHLFQGYGVELEYMVVDRDTLRVAPIVDRLLQIAAALPGAEIEDEEEGGNSEYPGSVQLGPIAWSNELALHVLEFKVSTPSQTLSNLADTFHKSITTANAALAPMNAQLLPCGMHPLMNPDTEMTIWPHGYSEVYEAFNKIFDCKGHGWSNLQSAHLNLPFAGDDEFGRLHAAIRFILPILPALAASSPMMDGGATGLMDNRLDVYSDNARNLPITSGKVIPEPVFTHDDYERVVLRAIYKAFEPHDPNGVLRHEWANSRGAIARFTRSAIEIRVLDVQECPRADLAIIAAISSVLRAMVEGRLSDLIEIKKWGVEPLHALLLTVIRDADQARIADPAYLRALGFTGDSCSARQLWQHLVESTFANDPGYPEFKPALDVILSQGCAARRMMAHLRGDFSAPNITRLLRELASCLAENRMLEP